MEKILKEEIIDVRGTTKLTVGDPRYLDAIADGTIGAAKRNLYSMVLFLGRRLESFGSVRSIVLKMSWNGILSTYLYFRQVNRLCSTHIWANSITTEQLLRISISAATPHTSKFIPNMVLMNFVLEQMAITGIFISTNRDLVWI